MPEPEAANIVMAPGELSEEDLISGVDRGVYVQRFWYTRLVDRVEGTITGVTRDACFLIEHGRLTAPIAACASPSRCSAAWPVSTRSVRSCAPSR